MCSVLFWRWCLFFDVTTYFVMFWRTFIWLFICSFITDVQFPSVSLPHFVEMPVLPLFCCRLRNWNAISFPVPLLFTGAGMGGRWWAYERGRIVISCVAVPLVSPILPHLFVVLAGCLLHVLVLLFCCSIYVVLQCCVVSSLIWNLLCHLIILF